MSYCRIEVLKAVFEEVVVSPQVLDSFANREESGRAIGDADECLLEAFESFVGSEPVLGFEKRNEGAELSAQPLGAPVEELIVVFDELGDGAGVILAPMLVKKVVEEDVDNDAGESEALGSEQGLGRAEDRMVVGEAIDAAMHHDAIDDRGGEPLEQGGGGAFLKVAQDVADARGVVGTGQGEMGEEVHF